VRRHFRRCEASNSSACPAVRPDSTTAFRAPGRICPIRKTSATSFAYCPATSLPALERVAPRKVALSDAQFARMEEFIAANIAENLTCPQIAGALDLPVRAVVEGVKGRTGYSLYRFVVDKRVEAAAALLRETRLPISEVAFECGFSSQQHMTSVFAERLGLTPMRLRKNAGVPPSA
jgi:transcriptional regulator GlxA family with amidase domain